MEMRTGRAVEIERRKSAGSKSDIGSQSVCLIKLLVLNPLALKNHNFAVEILKQNLKLKRVLKNDKITIQPGAELGQAQFQLS